MKHCGHHNQPDELWLQSKQLATLFGNNHYANLSALLNFTTIATNLRKVQESLRFILKYTEEDLRFIDANYIQKEFNVM